MATVKKCSQCHQDYTKTPKQAYWQFGKSLFCSKSCKGKAQGFQRVSQPIKVCSLCGSHYAKNSKQLKKWWEKSKFCSQSCYQIEAAIYMETSNYRGKENKEWKSSILVRDGFKCKMSNVSCTDRLEVHHLLRYSEYPELRYDVNNGITLCSFHHPHKKVEEMKLIPTFRELIWQQ